MNREEQDHIDRLERLVLALHDQVQSLQRRFDQIDPDSQKSPQSTTPTSNAPVAAVSSTPRSIAPRATSGIAPERSPVRPAPLNSTGGGKKIPRPKRDTSFDLGKLEWLLGIRGLMLVGVLIVIIAVGMFLKLAHDEGWIAALSPSTRCGSAAVFGALLIAVGELIRKKINPLASSGFSAAGIATLYASIYAASRMYDLLSTESAFSLLALLTFAGVFIGAISNRVMLTIFSLLGAFLVPVLLSTGEPSFFIMPAYLLFLLASALILSGWRGGHFAHARRIAWWCTGILGTLWLERMHDTALISVLVFVSLAWLMTVVELYASSRFFGAMRDRVRWSPACGAGFLRDDSGEIRFNPLSLFTPEARWINALFGATAWAVISAGYTINAYDPGLVYLSPIGLAALSVLVFMVVSLISGRSGSKLVTGKATPGSLYLDAIVINAALLVPVGIAIALGGWVEVLAWLGVGLAAGETARRIRFRALGIFGLLLIGVAIARLMSYDLETWMDRSPDLTFLGLAMTPWSLQMLAASIAVAVFAWRSRYRVESQLCQCLALWLLAACTLHTQTELGSIAALGMILGTGAWWLGTAIRSAPLRINALSLAGLASLLALSAQFESARPPSLTLSITLAQVLILGVGWVAIAVSPRARYALRSTGAALAVFFFGFALAKLDETHSSSLMVLAQALLLASTALAARRCARWSLGEIAGGYLMLLALIWGTVLLVEGSSAYSTAPMRWPDSFAILITLGAMLLLIRRLGTIALPDDGPESLGSVRSLLLGMLSGWLWFFLLAASSLEIVRSTHMIFDARSALGASLSIWWSVFAISSVALGFRLPRQLRWAGLTLLCLVAVKVLLIDTMTLAPTARIVAALSVGLIMIATGVVYTRLVESIGKIPPSSEPTEPPEPA